MFIYNKMVSGKSAEDIPEEDIRIIPAADEVIPFEDTKPAGRAGRAPRSSSPEPVATDDGSCAPKPKRKPGRPPGALNKKTIAKQSALAADPPAAPQRGAQSKARRPKKTSTSSSSDGSAARIVVKRRKKRVVVVEESDSSPSPVIVKRKRESAPRPSPPPAAPEQSAPVTLERLGNSLKDAQLERMIARQQQYQGYFARLR